ncbi:MAG: SDR family NAD(P)-dependent oxidoreductase [Desulfobacteraceae bacterium]|nr:SDR family NAD(P)-dependent oxidoreductase [Desulfobacteraceae bacterium]
MTRQQGNSAGDIAVIGMAGFFPDAADVHAYWRNIVRGLVSIREVPPDRWDWRQYYDPDQRRMDRINSRWGSFLPEVFIDPLYYGIPPNSLNYIETSQLLTLESTRMALDDAGYLDREFDRRRTSVFIGTGAAEGDLGQYYSFRSMLPGFFGQSAERVLSGLDSDVPEWSPDTFTGIIMNITAGRVADRFNLGGSNFTVDAACASALAALRTGILELKAGESDMVIAGGADTLMSPYAYTCFSKVSALSASGQSIPFDEKADGIVLGEAVGTVILKRLEDAENDGDRIYAVIKGMGASSDGKGKGLTYPRPEGQAAAISRAYENAGIDPGTVELIEAHGTGTKAGDKSEAEALTTYFSQTGMPAKSCAVGSVKSMIGHTKCAAGIASLVKAVLALHHKVLPPTAGIDRPLADLVGEDNPLYVNTRPRPWFAPDSSPRRAGVSAFGFGGTNFHTVLEEYTGPAGTRQSVSAVADWDTELLVFSGQSNSELTDRIQLIERALESESSPELKDLAYTLAADRHNAGGHCLAIVAVDTDDLKEKLNIARSLISGESVTDRRSADVYLRRESGVSSGKTAFVFPGQGSQYTGMLRDLCMAFPQVRAVFERFDAYLSEAFPGGLSRIVYPPDAFTSMEKQQNEEALTRSSAAQSAMGAADVSMLEILKMLGVEADMAAGHSYGEYAGLYAAGVLDEASLARISEARGRFILESAHPEPGTMAAVRASEDAVNPVISDMDQVWVANLNAPVQTVISGTRAGVQAAVDRLNRAGYKSRMIPVSCAFHSPIVSGAQSKLDARFAEVSFHPPEIFVFSNTTAEPFPERPEEIRQLLIEQLVRPVRFVDEIEAMYAAGARTFVEVGAGNVLTNLISRILADKPHQVVCMDKKGVSGLTGLQHALAALAASGVELELERLFAGRGCRMLDLENPVDTVLSRVPKTAWIINGGGARPLDRKSREPVSPRLVCFADETAAPACAPGDCNDPALEKARTSDGATGYCSDGRDCSNIEASQYEGEIMTRSLRQDGQNTDMQCSAADETVIARFQELMSQFLETQKEVMTAYLNGGGNGDRAATARAEALQAMTSVSRGHLPEAAETGRRKPDARAPESAPQPEAAAPDLATSGKERSQQSDEEGHAKTPEFDIKTILLQIVSDCTGYPSDMLELDQEIESDLGIDSIKRMQAVEQLEAELADRNFKLSEAAWEQLVESRTLGDIVSNLQSALAGGSPEPAEKSRSGFSEKRPEPAYAESEAASAGQTPGKKAAASASFDAAATLMGIVSDLSGYPSDMLEPDQEIEADLGIDSIKRMQILEHLEAELETHSIRLSDSDIETLGESVTLGDIIAKLAAVAGDGGAAAQQDSESSSQAAPAISEPDDGEHGAPWREKNSKHVAASEEEAPGEKPEACETGTLTRDALAERLFWVVESATGFPAGTLELDLEIRADLDADEIVKDQIINDFITDINETAGASLKEDPGRKGDDFRYLGDLVDWAAASLEMEAHADTIRRFAIYARQQPLIVSSVSGSVPDVVLATRIPDDPVAAEVVAMLRSRNCRVITLEHGRQPENRDPDPDRDPHGSNYTANLGSFQQVSEVVDQIRKYHGPVSGLMHLVPLSACKSFEAMTHAEWQQHLRITTKSLFYLTKLLDQDLASASSKGVSSVVAATAMGGAFASSPVDTDSAKPEFFPGSGAVSGFLKALAEEMPALNIRAVDCDPTDSLEEIAAQLTNEFVTPSAEIEVGYRSGCRHILDIREIPIEGTGLPGLEIDSDCRILMTGGARGITAAAALELARRFQPTLLLVGRTPLAESEPLETAGIEDEKKLKSVLAEQLKVKQEKVRPMDVEEAYNRLIGQREIRDNLALMRAAGSEVRYYQADVTDAESLGRVMADIYDAYGRIDGVVHGAGRIEDKLVRDKDIESFDRVFDTKADSLFLLTWSLRPESLRFFALFSSVAGRFGNAGQADYGAANEVYNKTAVYLNQIWPGRVISFIWGPWESRGMVSDAVREKLNQNGISLIPREIGAQHFMNEIRSGPAADAEVVYGGWNERKKALFPARRADNLPLLSYNANFHPSQNGEVDLIRRLETSHDVYLQDHRLDDNPVVPMAVALEMMAEAVAYRYPDFHLKTVRDLKVLQGIVLDSESADIHIAATPIHKSDDQVMLEVQIRDSQHKDRVYYQAGAELVREKQASRKHDPVDFGEMTPFPLSVPEAYEKQLFHGPMWQGIRQVDTIGENGIIGYLKTSRPQSYIRPASKGADGHWQIDPLLIDSGLQLVVLWMRHNLDATPLPSQIRSFIQYETPPGDADLRCEVRVNEPDGSRKTRNADLFFIRPDGRLSGRIEGLEFVGSASLNRLAQES